MPSGNLLFLSTEVRELADYPTSETDPDAPLETRNVIGDVLIEARRDGTIVREWKFFDLMDPYRLGYGSLNTSFYAQAYENVLDEPAPDWLHANGFFYDPATDTALVSSNHLSTVVKLDLKSGELVWMLGDPARWRQPWADLLLEPEGDLLWSYHHHAPKLTPNGTVLLFDNGSSRAIPPEPPLTPTESFSRAVEYEIDEANGTVRQIWSYGGPEEEWFLSPFISEAEWQPQTENILVTKGGQVRRNDGSPGMGPQEGHVWITLTEVTHTTPAEKVWEVIIDDPAVGWTAFRTERIPSLYR